MAGKREFNYEKRPQFLRDIEKLREVYPGKYLEHKQRKVLYSFTAYIDSNPKAPNLYFVRNLFGESFSFLFGLDKDGEQTFKVIQ